MTSLSKVYEVIKDVMNSSIFLTIITLIPLIISIIFGKISTNLTDEKDKKVQEAFIITSWVLGGPYILVASFIILRLILSIFIEDKDTPDFSNVKLNVFNPTIKQTL